MAGLNIDWSGFATLSKMDMQQCPKIFCNFVQKVLAKNKQERAGSAKQHLRLIEMSASDMTNGSQDSNWK